MNYLIINRDSVCNIIQNIISIINKSNCENINYSDLYPIINHIWDNTYFMRFGKDITNLIYKHKPKINDAIFLINNIMSVHNDDNSNNATFLLCSYLNAQNVTIDNIKSLNDIKINDDYFYLASLYPALSENLKKEAILWFRENLNALYYAALIHSNYRIPILDVATLSMLIEEPFNNVSKYIT